MATGPASTPPSARRALVAGATGLIGHALVRQLGAEGRSVLALVRRERPELAALPGVQLLRWQTEAGSTAEPALPPVDDLFCALGTTIKTAGSQAAFRAVDFDAVLAVARAARRAGATRLAVVSALGADGGSSIFYNRVKGEMEAAVAQLGYDSVVVARPSLLTGDRAALGQPTRPVESLALALARPLALLLPDAVRPIPASTVAAALRRAVDEARPGLRVLDSAALQRLGR